MVALFVPAPARREALRVASSGVRAPLASLLLLALAALPPAAAHVTFKLPSMPGVSPGNAGGFVPFDGPYLSHSPFLVDVPHSSPGNMTVGLQCTVPAGVAATPQAVPGYDLTLGFSPSGTVSNFSYTLNWDAQFPNGFAQPAVDFGVPTASGSIASANTLFSVLVGISITATGCNFTDANAGLTATGYPALYFPCVEVVVPASTVITTAAALVNAPLGVLLWTQTTSTQAMPSVGSSFALDAGAVVSNCASWPCSTGVGGTVVAPFGGASARVLEASVAPKIQLLPQNCMGINCTAVNGSVVAPYPNCPGGVMTMQGVATGNNTAALSALAATLTAPVTLSNRSIVAWLIVLTVVFTCFFAVQAAAALLVKPAPLAKQADAPAEDLPKDASHAEAV